VITKRSSHETLELLSKRLPYLPVWETTTAWNFRYHQTGGGDLHMYFARLYMPISRKGINEVAAKARIIYGVK